MKQAPFTYYIVEEEIRWTGEDEYPDIESEVSETVEADFNDALQQLRSQCWDNIDERGDGTVICYPADGSIDYRTGFETRTQLIIQGRQPHWTERLVTYYRTIYDICGRAK